MNLYRRLLKIMGTTRRGLMVLLSCLLFLSLDSTANGFSMGGSSTCTDPSTISVMPAIDRLDPITENIKSPTDIAIDDIGTLYVADLFDNSVKLFSPEGNYLGVLSGFAQPISVAVDLNGLIYVGNKQRGNVEVYDADFNFLHKLGSGDDEFSLPSDIAVDVFGRVFVADTNNDRVKIFNAADGTFLGLLGSSGTNDGQFHRPVSITIDTGVHEIVVLDRNPDMWGELQAKVQYFSMNGVFLRSFKAFGSKDGQMTGPQRIAVDNQSRLYISDSLLNTVLVYDKVGCYLGVVFEQVNHPRTPLGMAIGQNNKLYVTSHVTKGVEVYGIYETGVYGYQGMRIHPTELSLKSNEGEDGPQQFTITVENTGNVMLRWNASTEDEWILLSGQSFTNGLAGPGQENLFKVSIDKAGLELGMHEGQITFVGDTGIREVVDVQLEIKPSPILSVSPGALSFVSDAGVNPPLQLISVVNNGSATLSWSADTDRSWISFDTVSGNIANSDSDKDTIEVMLDVTGMPAGSYTGEISISGLNAYGSPVTIPVNLDLNQTAYMYKVLAKAGADGSLDSGSPSSQSVHYGETRSFTFNADDKCYVASITGCGIEYENTDKTVTARTETTEPIINNCIIYAAFATDAIRLSASTIGNGTGKIISAEPGIDCPGDCQNLYDSGDLVTLTAEASEDSNFSGWTGDCAGMNLVCAVTMDQARSVEAQFTTKFPWDIFMPAIMYNSKTGNK